MIEHVMHGEESIVGEGYDKLLTHRRKLQQFNAKEDGRSCATNKRTTRVESLEDAIFVQWMVGARGGCWDSYGRSS